MIIYLEGPDGAGKTTLAKHMQDRGWDYLHFGVIDCDLFKVYTDALANITRPTVIDRMHLSERVYGTVYRGIDRLADTSRMLERVLLKHDTLLIYCLPPFETCLQAFTSGREEYLKDPGMLKRIYDNYRHLSMDPGASSLTQIIYDWTRDDLDVLLCGWVDDTVHPPTKIPGAGRFAPGVTLLVGDQLNQGHWPFVSTTGCSPWLAKGLTQAGIPEADLYWVNAFRPDGRPEDLDFIEQLKPSKIIAMGQAAAKALRQQGHWDFTVVSHPQYHNRFQHRLKYPLFEEILKA